MGCTMHVDGLAVISQPVKCCNSIFNRFFCIGIGCFINFNAGVPAPLVGMGSTPKIFHLVIVHYHAKFSSYVYSGWSIEITGMEIFMCWSATLFG